MNNSVLDFATIAGQLNMSLKKIDLNFYMIMILFPVGIVLNLIQLYVFSKKTLNSKTNMGSMHALLSFFNLFALVNSILLTQLLPFLKVDIKNYTNFGCKLLSFTQRISLDIPSFQQVLITFQFYLSIKHPLKFIALQNSRKNYLVVIALMIIFAMAENIEYFFYELTLTYSNITSDVANVTLNTTLNSSNIQPSMSDYLTYNYICYSSFYLTISAGISSLLLRNFIPFGIMLVLNILIIVHVYQNHLKLNKSYKARGHKHFFLSIMSINALFFVLYLPWSIAQIIVFVQYFFTARSTTESISEGVLFFYNIGWSISYLNYMFPFFVYLGFNRLFRKELFQIVRYVNGEKSSTVADTRTINKSNNKSTNKSNRSTAVLPKQGAVLTVTQIILDRNTSVAAE